MSVKRPPRRRLTSDLQAMTRLQEIGILCARKDSELQECLDEILNAAIAFTRADKGNVQLFDSERRVLRIIAHRGFEQPFLSFFANVYAGEAAACGAAMRTGRRVVIADVTRSDVFAGQPALEVLADARVRAVQSTPLVSSGDRLIGMVSTHFSRPHRPLELELKWMDLLARQAADFLERKAAEEELRRLNEELREADRRKDVFLATLAHELRNPLAPIRTAVELLKTNEPESAKLERIHNMLERQVAQMARLLEDLLDASRISRGKIELRRSPVTLSSVVESAIETSRPAINLGRHELTIDLPAEAPILNGDPVRLAQVFSNLLNNAAKYTPDGGKIRLAAELDAGHVVVSVKDTGIGIAPETLPRVFEMFSQVKPAGKRSQGGLGIGLSLAKEFIKMHGGTIEARSPGLGRGTEIVVRLPAQLARASEEPALRAGEATRDPANGCRVLIADDSQDCVDALAMFLELMGHKVYTAYDGQEALLSAEKLRPEVALLDIGMPILNGYQVCRAIRERPWGQGMFIVAVTGWGREEDRHRSAEAGFNRHLVKPVSPTLLAELLAYPKVTHKAANTASAHDALEARR